MLLLPSLPAAVVAWPAPASAQPQIVMPPADPPGSPAGAGAPASAAPGAPLSPAAPATTATDGEPRRAVPRAGVFDLPRESDIGVPLDEKGVGGSTGIGAYGEILLTAPSNGEAPVVDVRRLVVFLGHNFTERLRVYTELEVEHAVSSASDHGEFEVEQLFGDYLVRRWFNVRAGLILMPVGIVNQFHEPPTFNGALRPETDTRIIPSTWREVGAGIFGGAGPMRWQLYAVTSFKAHDFSSEGIRDAHQEGQLAIARDWGGVARLDYAPIPGLSIGASGYYADAAQGDPALGGARVSLGLVEADLRFRWKGIEARAEFVNLWIGNSPVINAARKADADGMTPPAAFEPVSRQLRGGYGELGYNLLQPFHLKYSSSLVAFGRYERTNTQADVVGFAPVAGKDRQLITFGLNFRPIAEVAVKLDYQRITTYGDSSSSAWNQLNAGLAFMF